MLFRQSLLKLCLGGLFASVCSSGWAQQPGDYATAGWDSGRSGLNPHAGRFSPPFVVDETFALPGTPSPSNLLVFDEKILVGEGQSNRYMLLNARTGSRFWTRTVPGSPGELDFVPAATGDIVLLAAATTSILQAVEISSSRLLWSAPTSGELSGRHPLLLPGTAVWADSARVTAADPATGSVFWQFPTTSAVPAVGTSRAPVAAAADRVFALLGDGTLAAVDLVSGRPVWQLPLAGGDGSDLVVVEGMVYVTNRSRATLLAVDVASGMVRWEQPIPGTPASPGLLLGFGRLYLLSTVDGRATVSTFDPSTGELLWQTEDPSVEAGAPQHGRLADNLLFYYHSGAERVRVMDATTGTILWSLYRPGLRSLVPAAGSLYLLLPNRVEALAPEHRIFIPQLADGEGAQTLLTVVNVSDSTTVATVEFFSSTGAPLALEVGPAASPVQSVHLTLPAGGSAMLQTLGNAPGLRAGWATVVAGAPIRATAAYQVVDSSGRVLFEAGVEDATAADRMRVFAARSIPTPGVELNTGVAVVNPTEETATLILRYLRREPSPALLQRTVTLEPGEHLPAFLDELFEDEATQNSWGTLVIESDVPVAATALRTQNGYQLSSYPVAISKR